MTGFFARPGCSPRQRTLLAVQVVVGPVVGGHRLLLSLLLTKSSLMMISSVKTYLRKSSVLTGRARMDAHHRRRDAEERAMSNAPTQQTNRLDRRKARTRAALIRAAQTLIAEGRTNVPILEITQAADVGMGSFYNHFETKEQLFEAAVEARDGRLRSAARRPDRRTSRTPPRCSPAASGSPGGSTAGSPSSAGSCSTTSSGCSAPTTAWRPALDATSRPPWMPAASTSRTSTSRSRWLPAPCSPSASCCTTSRTATSRRPPTG